MGVYINGMEMPRNCDDCRFDIDCAYDESQDGYKMIGGRPRKCPLVPAADMRPVIHGRNTGNARIFECSICGYGIADIFLTNERDYPIEPNYCPNCGVPIGES